MNTFIFFIIFIAIVVSLIFIKFLNKPAKNISVEEINTKLFQQQFNEIESDLNRGLIEKDEYVSMKKELSKRVLSYASKNTKNDIYQDNKLLNFSIFFIIIILFFITFFTYFYNGNPTLPDLSFHKRSNYGVPSIFYEEALKDVEKKIQIQPDNIELHILKANTYSLLGKQDYSLKLWKYIIDSYPEQISADIYLSYGESLMQEAMNKQNEILISDKAFKMFEKASIKSEISSEVWAISSFYVGLYFYQKNKINEAKDIWSFVIDESPVNASWRSNLLEQINQILPDTNNNFNDEEIIEMVNRLAKRLYTNDSENILDWQKLGKSFMVLGKINKAIDAYNRALILDSENIDSLIGLAEAKLLNLTPEQKVTDDILKLFNTIIIHEPSHPLALWVLAEEEINLNNFNKAKILLNNLLLQLNPDSEEYKLVVDKLEQINR